MKTINQKIILNNGLEMPQFGFGSYEVNDETVGYEAVKQAINDGYLLIDTADFYQNQKIIARAIKDSNKKREELFLTSKIWNDDQSHDQTLAAFEKILAELETDYLDLILVHWPAKNGIECYQALEQLYEAKKVKAIGVCNFEVADLEALLKVAKYVPMVNQVEMHPLLPQTEILKYCQEHNIAFQSWRTMLGGKTANEVNYLTELSQKYGVDNASICLRWAVQQGVMVIPRSNNSLRILSNATNIDKFSLTSEEITKISDLGPETRLGPDPKTFGR